MDFISNKKRQADEMLKKIGLSSIEDLFQAVPSAIRCPPIITDDGLSEFEGVKLMESLAAKNLFGQLDSYMGAGAYEHHIPAIVGPICQKSEFLTSYTPYQPEASQGMLQVIFEFQSAICALTGMECSNASLYDAASACAEALLMALRIQKNRSKILIAGNLHPHYRGVVDLYLKSLDVNVVTIPTTPEGNLMPMEIGNDVAGILIQSPNFYGIMESVGPMIQQANEQGAIAILCANPLSFGLYQTPWEQGFDVVVGDTQPFGLPLMYGGPYCGYIACKKEFVRQLPGRLVGETVDSKGKPGFVLTLQAREQHIRREKATSNICSNQALAALASLITILWYGKEGVKKLAETNFQRASYLRKQLSRLPNLRVNTAVPIFNEFVVDFLADPYDVLNAFRDHGIEPGVALDRFHKERKGAFLVAVTETKSKEQLDRYVDAAKNLGRK
jgi:glycine dehydrogenase subunit 1